MSSQEKNYLNQLEDEAIYILRETAAQFERPALLFSGGKDSIVAAELLKQEQKALTGFMLNPHPAQNNIVKLLGIEALSMQRKIDPQLFDLNTREGTYDGHIPISAIYAFISLFAAMIYDYRYIIVYGKIDKMEMILI